MPETISQSAAFSADGMTIASVVLMTAYILKLSFQKSSPTWKQLSVALLLCVVVCLVKPLYVPVLGLLVLLPVFNKQFRQQKSHLLSLAAIALCSLVAFLLWLHSINFIKTEHSGFNPTANYYVMKAFVEHRPITFLHTMYHTYFTNQAQINNLFNTFFGAYRENNVALPTIFALATTVVLVLSVLVSSPRDSKLNYDRLQIRIFRSIALLIFVTFWLLVSLVMYVTYTDVYSTSIVGVQGRYFIPILPLFLLIFYGTKIQNDKSIKIGMVACILVILVASSVTAYNGYYHLLPLYYT
jgi:uncharacterized membrane protein